MSIVIKILLFILVGIAYTHGLGNGPSEIDWESFKKFHGRNFSSPLEEENSRIIFEKNVAVVIAHNKAFREGKVSYSKELNSFSDIDPIEFGKRNGFVLDNVTLESRTVYPNGFDHKNYEDTLPASFDWRETNMVSPVKNQGQCGSCWAFSATGAMESQILIASGGQMLVLLSEEQLIECDGSNNGCKGGMYTRAWEFLKERGGIESEDAYPYSSSNGDEGQCKFSLSKAIADVLDYVILREHEEEFVKQTLANHGPISVAIDASDLSLVSAGIYSCDQRKVKLNHAVLLIGYGNDEDGDFWIVKNSWGTKWGLQGFFKLSRQSDKDCGMTKLMAYPTVKARSQMETWSFQKGLKFCLNLDSVNSFMGLVVIILLVLVVLSRRESKDSRDSSDSERSEEFVQDHYHAQPDNCYLLSKNEKV